MRMDDLDTLTQALDYASTLSRAAMQHAEGLPDNAPPEGRRLDLLNLLAMADDQIGAARRALPVSDAHAQLAAFTAWDDVKRAWRMAKVARAGTPADDPASEATTEELLRAEDAYLAATPPTLLDALNRLMAFTNDGAPEGIDTRTLIKQAHDMAEASA